MRIAQVVIVILGIVILVCGIVMGAWPNGPNIVRNAGPVVAIAGLLVGLTSLLLTHKKTT